VEQLTVAQAARRLGVKPPTLYAYVSRGVLRSHRAADGRSSLFDPADIEVLARRGRPRRSSRRAALDIVIETSITSIDRDQLHYRGHEVGGLARTRPFEEVAGLLLTGTSIELDEPWPVIELEVPMFGRTLDRLAWTVQLVAATDELRGRRSADDVGRRLVSAMVGSFPSLGEGHTPRLRLPERAPLRSTVAGRLWTRLASTRPPTTTQRHRAARRSHSPSPASS
jgi:citrate synthase